MASKTRKSMASTPVSSAPSSSTPKGSSSNPEKKGTPLSPARMTRMQEKLELQNLNDRLATYIDRVRFLEAENSRLSVQVHSSQETVTREVNNIKTMYQNELKDARQTLDEIAKEKAMIALELSNLKQRFDELNQRFNKREREFENLGKKKDSLETYNQDLQNKVNQLTSEKRKLEENLKDVDEECKKIAAALEEKSLLHEKEALLRIDLENKMMSLREELTFRESIHEKELSESRILKSTEITDIDQSFRETYEQKLAENLRELREQYEEQMRINRDEMINLYETKLADLQAKLGDTYDMSQSKEAEMRDAKMKVEEMSSRVTELQSHSESQARRIKDLENLLNQEREWHSIGLKSKEDELRALREDIEKQLHEYQELLDIKVALDLEIAAYRKLIEVEENRLNIMPLKSPVAEGMQRSTPVRRTPMRSTKRKRTVIESGEKSTSDTQSSSSSKSDVEIEDHDMEGKYIKLYNKGSTEVPLVGWQLIRKAGEQEITYKFHKSTIIKANSHITVWSSDAGATHHPPTDFVMKNQRWVTADSMSSVLLNNNGEEMAVRETSKRSHRSMEERVLDTSSFYPSQYSAEEIFHQQGDLQHPQERCSVM